MNKQTNKPKWARGYGLLIQVKDDVGSHLGGNNGEYWLDSRYRVNVSKQDLFKGEMSGEREEGLGWLWLTGFGLKQL